MNDVPSLNPGQVQQVKAVAADLLHLRSTWAGDPTDDHLRRESTILRGLLVDRHYAQAWNLLGLPRQPYVAAPDLSRCLADVPPEFVLTAFAPIATTVKGQIEVQLRVTRALPAGSQFVISPGYANGGATAFVAVTPEDIQAGCETPEQLGAKLALRMTEYYPLDSFVSSPSAMLDGTYVSRRQVIKYVANTLGGAHFGRRRAGGRDALAFDLLESHVVRHNGTRRYVYIELMSIGQFVAQSTDAHRLAEMAERLPEP